MNINFKEWQTELLWQNGNHLDSQDIREILKKYKVEIDQQNFKRMFAFIHDDARYSWKVGLIASLILQHDIAALKDVCITADNCIASRIFQYCSFDEFSNQKLGFDVSEVKDYAFDMCKANKISINGKNDLTMRRGCITSSNPNFIAHISAGNNLQIDDSAFIYGTFYELKLTAVNIINMNIDCIYGSTINRLIIDAPVLRVDGLGNCFKLKRKNQKWTFSINRLVISKDIVNQWSEAKIFKMFKPNILEIL